MKKGGLIPPPLPSRIARLDLAVASVHVDFYTRNVRRILRGQESDHTGYFLGLPESLHRNPRNYIFRELVHGFLRQTSLSKEGGDNRPGATVFTRMPRPTSSPAAVRARERSAALVAAYALVPGEPLRSTTLVFKIIEAPSFRKGSAFWMVKYAPLILVSNCSSKALSEVSAKGANFAMPAFTNKTSILPSF